MSKQSDINIGDTVSINRDAISIKYMPLELINKLHLLATIVDVSRVRGRHKARVQVRFTGDAEIILNNGIETKGYWFDDDQLCKQ